MSKYYNRVYLKFGSTITRTEVLSSSQYSEFFNLNDGIVQYENLDSFITKRIKILYPMMDLKGGQANGIVACRTQNYKIFLL